jgi:uncharacterized protein (TIGR02099 family)
MPIRLIRSLPRIAFLVAVCLSLALAAAVIALRYAVVPNIERYRADIVKSVSTASGMAVSAGQLHGGWEGFRPFIDLTDVRFSDPKLALDAPALVLPALHASLSWWSLFLGEIRFHELTLDGPELSLTRSSDGTIYFAGKPLNRKIGDAEGQIVSWFLEQPHLSVRNAALQWQDNMTDAPALRFAKVDMRIEKRGKLHRFGLRAVPSRELAVSVEAQGALEIRKNTEQWELSGALYAVTTQASLAELRRHLPIPEVMRDATGNVRAWIDIDSAQPHGIRSITADLNVIDATAQFSRDLAPLELANLVGRVEYQAKPGGFLIVSRGLQLRTREGIQLAPADFSLSLIAEPGKAARGDVMGDSIDLKVMAALMQYFPVGKEVREAVARFAPRGRVNQASVSWSGDFPKVQTYRLKGRFADLVLNAEGKIPGVKGLSGSIEGDEHGGELAIASKGLSVDIGQVFRAPLFFDTLAAEARWKKNADDLAFEFSRIAFANPDAAGEISGTYRTGGKGLGIVDLKGSLSRADATKVADYLPNTLQPTRAWLDAAIRAGKIDTAHFELSGDLRDFPFRDDRAGKFHITSKAEGVGLKFLPDWPAIDAIKGEIVFSGARIGVKAESAAIFGARIGPATAEIDDVGSLPPLLTVKGTANAPAQEVARYLQESPLAEGVGKFTQVLAMEGPGKLDLSLSIPLGRGERPGAANGAKGKAREPLHVAGRYQLSRAEVKPPVGAKVTNVNGVIEFTEQAVKSEGLAGIAYGNPLQIAISSSEGGVVTDLLGRSDVANLNDFLPFRIPAQVTGTTDWRGRIVARAGRVDLVFTSDLTGVSSGLPAPLAKHPDQPLKLIAEFTETGHSAERINLQLGDVLYGRFARRFDEKGRVSGLAGGLISLERPIGSQPLPEGLWLAGNMRELDIDHWKATFGSVKAAAGPITAAENPASSVITGFDLNVEKMRAFGREFKTLQMKGRRAGDDWRVVVESPELSGDALWRPTAEEGRGSVRARLKNLVLNTEQPSSADVPPEANRDAQLEFPVVDIEAERFQFRGYDLGKLEFKAAPDGVDWRIDRLFIQGDGSSLDTSGRWTRTGGQSHSTFKLKVESKNLNGLFKTFGHADTLRRGVGQLEGTLGWSGYPYEFALNNLVGDFRLEAKSGQFAKIEPGAGRLLGLLSLQSIPRRITLDFRDIFSEGFAFDRINGTVKIDRGVMRTEDFEIAGPSAFVTMQGEVSLPSESQKLRVTVIPALGDSVSLITGLIGGPVVGLTTLLVQKLLRDPLGKASTYQYNVVGTWDNPDVIPVARNETSARDVNAKDVAEDAVKAIPSATTQNRTKP